MEYYIIILFCFLLFIFKYLGMYKIVFILEKIYVLILILFVGFRKNIDPDYLNYKDIYEKSVLSEKIVIEKGYYYINNFFGNIGMSFELLIFFIALISIIFKYKFLKKYCKYYLLGVFIYLSTYLFFQEFIQIRQAISISILTLSFPFIIEKKIIKFFSIICFASLFHTGSFIFILVYFCWNTRIRNYIENYYYFILFFSILSFELLEKIFINISIYLAAYSKISIYLNQRVVSIPYRTLFSGIFFLEIKKKIDFKLNQMDKLVFCTFKIGIIFCILTMSLGEISFRFRLYFLWLECYILVKILEKLNYKKIKFYFFIIIGLFYLFIFHKFLKSQLDRGYFIPYSSILKID